MTQSSICTIRILTVNMRTGRNYKNYEEDHLRREISYFPCHLTQSQRSMHSTTLPVPRTLSWQGLIMRRTTTISTTDFSGMELHRRIFNHNLLTCAQKSAMQASYIKIDPRLQQTTFGWSTLKIILPFPTSNTFS